MSTETTAQAIRLQGSQGALVALAAEQRDRAVAAAHAAFEAACRVVLLEHGVAAGTLAPDPQTGGWLLLLAPDGPFARPALQPIEPTSPALKAAAPVRRRFTDTSVMTDDEQQRYAMLRAQQGAQLADATAADDDDTPRGPTGPELMASLGTDFGAFGAH